MNEVAAMAVWPGYATAKKQTTDLNAGMSNHKWLVSNTTPNFKVTYAATVADASTAANMWLKHPAYKMTLASTLSTADANQDGQIDRREFASLLSTAGYKGSSAETLFAQLDKDGDGSLTAGELKFLSQGKTVGAQARRLGA